MNAYLIIAAWVFGWLLLACVGDSIVAAVVAVGWLGGSGYLLSKNKEALRRMDRLNKWIDKQTNK